MSGNIFSQEGKNYYEKKLSELAIRARESGTAVGEAAGDNCDWHDNFDYEQATRDFEMDSRRVGELREALANAEIIIIQEQTRRVAIGSTVEFEFADGKEKEITIGAWGESDPSQGLVSYTAPLAQAVIGKEEGDEGHFKGQAINITKIHPASYRYRALIATVFS